MNKAFFLMINCLHLFIWGCNCALPFRLCQGAAVHGVHASWVFSFLLMQLLTFSRRSPLFKTDSVCTLEQPLPSPIMVSIYSIITVIFPHCNAFCCEISLQISSCKDDHWLTIWNLIALCSEEALKHLKANQIKDLHKKDIWQDGFLWKSLHSLLLIWKWIFTLSCMWASLSLEHHWARLRCIVSISVHLSTTQTRWGRVFLDWT